MKRLLYVMTLAFLIMLVGCSDNTSGDITQNPTGVEQNKQPTVNPGTPTPVPDDKEDGTQPTIAITPTPVLTNMPDIVLSDMGMLGITYDGTRYRTKGYMDEMKNIYVSEKAIDEIFQVEVNDSVEMNGKSLGNLTKLCQTQGMESVQYDDVLNAVYIWSREFSILGQSENQDLERIDYYQLGTPSEETLTYIDFFTILDKAVEIISPERIDEWRKYEDLLIAREAKKTVTRYEASLLTLYLAVFLGDDYSEFNNDWTQYNSILGEDVWCPTAECGRY